MASELASVSGISRFTDEILESEVYPKKEIILLSEETAPVSKQVYIPISIFDNDSLSALEAISKYLIENMGFRYCEIARLLGRNDRTIWGAYSNARKKMQSGFVPTNDNYFAVPLFIFKSRSLSVLETITCYLKDELNLRYCRIASLLNRDDRTVWTVYMRAKKKKAKKDGIL